MARFLLFILVLLGPAAFAAEPVAPVTIENSEYRTIRSDKIGQTYDLFISLPADYATSGQSYPVLYILDGWHFTLMAYFQNNNIYSERMPPVIMVNIGHGRGVNPLPLRARDFIPTKLPQEPTSGGAAAFLDFLEHDIIPLVDRTYRTLPADRGLLGHSYGGLFALYALEQRPELFQRIVAASPTLDWDHDLLIKSAPARLQPFTARVRLDLSSGTEHDNDASVTAFTQVLDQIKPPGLDYRCTLYPGENHNSVRFASFPPGLYWVYRP